jgi:hypothetical protein
LLASPRARESATQDDTSGDLALLQEATLVS